MQIPVRVQFLLRSTVPAGVLLATALGALVLGANPFLIPAVADDYGIALAQASLITTVQLGSFVVGSWVAGRYLQPRRRVFVVACAIAVVANLGSAMLPPFTVLIALRLASGLSLGLITWFGWVLVFGDDARTGEVAVIGPLVSVAGAPVLSGIAEAYGADGIFLFMGLLALIPLAVNAGTVLRDPIRRAARRHRPVPAAVVLLTALGLMTLGGSSVFTFGAVIATSNTGLAPSTIALAYSANALAAVPSSRATRRPLPPAFWMLVTAASAVVLGFTSIGWLFFASMAAWGFAFWMGIPGVFSRLAAKSRYPEERAGDAQAVMALGRVFGPVVGGTVLDATSPGTLGVVGGVVITTAALLVALAGRGAG